MSLAEKKVIRIGDVVSRNKPELKLAEPIEKEMVENRESVILPFLIDGAGLVWDAIKLRFKVYPQLIGEGIGWALKRLREASRSFWGAVWVGNVFPLKMTIVDFSNGKDELVNARMIGRFMGLVVISLLNSFSFIFGNRKILIGFAFLGVCCLVNPVASSAFWLFLALVSVVYFPLGFWKARNYRGFKNLIKDGMDRLVEQKKCKESE
jgi:hypothetical protein